MLRYVTEPTPVQLEKIRSFVYGKYVSEDITEDMIRFTAVEDKSLGGGFILTCGNETYNWSTEGRSRQFTEAVDRLKKHISADTDITSMLRTTVEEFELTAAHRHVGVVSYVGDGIATIVGLPHAAYGEILIFECGIKGMVQDIRQDEIAAILFGSDREIRVGSHVARTVMTAGVPVGSGFLGRVVNALGEPIDGLGRIDDEDYRPVENAAPSIVDRKSVDTPMETGILAIDSMFPIGRGQRELIIGDRQTGKTAIALDTIINQKGKDVICIYVSICQKASTVASLVNKLKAFGAMDYTIVINCPASDAAPLEFIAPYAGCTLGEYFMSQGKDVLIVYDDLSKHAVAYRTISLLLGRTPGREAFPGDIFYIHSRLLERSAHLSDELGGGSMTALPIVETQAGDVSAYIPTNVISITDGQIFLESSLFFSGQRPAVNVGISVSRIGGDAQTKAMKKASGTLKLDLAQYREMAAFTQFSGDLDDASKEKLEYGKRLMHILRQKQFSPIPRHRQVIILTTALGGRLKNTADKDIDTYLEAVCCAVEEEAENICRSIDKVGAYSPEIKEEILRIADKTEI